MILRELQNKLKELMDLPSETEWVEFKEAKNNYDFDDLGRYFSALSNEANLKDQESGWLVFGVTNKPPRQICGTNYRRDRAGLDNLKREVAKQTNHRITFEEIHELSTPNRVIMFQIPPAPRGIPTTWRGHAFGRDHESLGQLNLQEIEKIRGQVPRKDWSAQICPAATLDDLDTDAVRFARDQYRIKHPELADEIAKWDNVTFLNKAKVCISGKITRTALVLLGKPESEHHLSPSLAQITWVLRDGDGTDRDYHHWGPPFILTVDQLQRRIRNLTVRHMPSGTLFPREVSQYDPWVLRECLHNCIAHQDYFQLGRINVVEGPESVLFTNLGDFIPVSVENIIRSNALPDQYRNYFLAGAMVNLNMIDTIGSGIKRMFTLQRERFFPMPDYDLNEPDRVKVRLYGKILDEKYTQMLAKKADIDLMDAIALDKVQKRHALTEDEFKRLKSRNLIEGRRPNLFISAKLAEAIEEKATYIKHRPFHKNHYKDMVVSYIEKFKQAARQDIDALLLDKLSDVLDEGQKGNFIRNLLQEMKREGAIIPIGKGRRSKWVLSKKDTPV